VREPLAPVDPADLPAEVDQDAAPRQPPSGMAAAHAAAEVAAAANGHRRPEDASGLLVGLRNGAWLDAQVFPPLTYAVPGLIPEGSVLLVGPPKIGKSWLVLAAALAAASGGRALGIKVERRPVLYLALEDGDRRLQDRCRRLLAGPISEAFEYLTRVEHGRVLDTIAAWLEREHDAPPLVILDTLGKVMPQALPGESAYQRDYRVGTALAGLAAAHPGIAMLTNHHDRKANSNDFVDSVSGTHGLAGAADTILVLTRDRGETAALLQVTGRDVPEGEYALTFTDGAVWDLDGADLGEAAKHAREARATAGLGDRSAEVVRFAGQHPDGVTPAQVAKELGVEQNAARAYLSRLAEAGRLSKPRRGLYTPVASVASVASEGAGPPQGNTGNGSNTPSGDADGWTIGDPAPCVSCGRPAGVRDPDGRPRHRPCPEPGEATG
jgi:AAA domain/Transcriptional regulator, AbiEi antitoxin